MAYPVVGSTLAATADWASLLSRHRPGRAAPLPVPLTMARLAVPLLPGRRRWWAREAGR